MRHFLLAAAPLLALLIALFSPHATARERGYIELEDGIGLRYSIDLPEGQEGPFPVLLQYQGYGAGSNPNDNGISLVSARWLELGFAVLGVSLRGTGCSEGDFDLFETQWVDDARQVLDWIITQPWSNGDVAMVGLSFPGMTQMMVGPLQHPAVKALMPWSAMTDLYRDVGWPGGIFNLSFATGWTGLQKSGYQYLNAEIQAGNTRCIPAVARHNDLERIVVLFGQTHPYAEHFVYERFVPEGSLSLINVPVLLSHAWQDEQISPRTTIDYEQLDPEQTWHIYGNGVHGYGLGSPTVVATAERFLRHFLLGEDNGFPSTPKVQIEREVAFAQPARWIDSLPAWPAQTQPAELYFSPEGTLDRQRPELSESFSYLYPLPAPSMTAALAASTENQTYALPIAPGGAALFTTPPLEHDLSLLGPSRVDLWLSSTANDTDVQISLTEVRPDGREMFVQRGWLRASHRAMDVRENRATAPYHWFSEATQSPLLPDEPTLLSIEILPVAHVFRAGSSLRLRVEAPVGTTGFRQLEFNPTPAVNTVHVGPQHLSRITLSLWPGHQAPVDYPDCANQANQPCRDSDAAQPSGSLRVPTALAATSPQGGTVQAGPQSLSLHNRSAEPHYLRAVTLNLPQAHTLYSASMVLDGEATQVLAPKHQARFELPDRLLAPGERVELHWTLQASQQAAYWPLLNSAHAGLNPIGLSAFGSLLAWLGLAWIGRPRRGRGLPLLLILSGLLVACQGGRSELPSAGADEPQSSSSVLQVEVVNSQGQFVRYSP